MQDLIIKKPENSQISDDNSDNFDIPVDISAIQEQKEIENNTIKESQKIPEKALTTANEQNISDNILLPSDIPNNEPIKNNKEKTKTETNPRVIIKEVIIEKKLTDEEIKILYKKILLKHLKNAREKRQAIYENNLKSIEQKGNNEKFTPKSIAKDLKVSKRTASRYLRKLFNQGKIMRFGNGKRLFYQVCVR